jgi:ferritin
MYCHSIGLDFTADSFIDYAKKSGTTNQKFKEFINSEDILKDFYRKKILKEDLKSIKANKGFYL